jgi:hypothetical protein
MASTENHEDWKTATTRPTVTASKSSVIVQRSRRLALAS